MTTGKRIRTYAVGFLMGCVIVYVMLFRGTNRTYWLPQNRIKEQMLKGKLIFSEHAQCRMKCRAISEEEVKDILKNGSVNFSQSHPRDSPCPSYAFDGMTADKQNVRIVFASCDTLTTKVVTAIDLGLEKDTCQCN